MDHLNDGVPDVFAVEVQVEVVQHGHAGRQATEKRKKLSSFKLSTIVKICLLGLISVKGSLEILMFITNVMF